MQFVFHNQALSKYIVDNFLDLILCASKSDVNQVSRPKKKKNPLTVQNSLNY